MSVNFTWYPVSFSEDTLVIQVNFDRPYDISMFWDQNELEVEIWDLEGDIFRKSIDGSPLPPSVQGKKQLPQ